MALAAELPPDDVMTANTSTTWQAVIPDLPDQPILAFISGTRHGTREVFEQKVFLQVCEDSGAMARIMAMNGGDADAAQSTCMAIRSDGLSVDIDGNQTETLARIGADNNGIGVFGLSFCENNTASLQVATMSIPTIVYGPFALLMVGPDAARLFRPADGAG